MKQRASLLGDDTDDDGNILDLPGMTERLEKFIEEWGIDHETED